MKKREQNTSLGSKNQSKWEWKFSNKKETKNKNSFNKPIN